MKLKELLAYHLEPFKDKIGSAISRRRNRKNFFPKELEFNWNSINYNRIALINLLISTKDNAKYLEIGCATNSLFDSVYASKKIGVDPNNGGNVRLTSDRYFEANKDSFDVVFIDGLHTYEQARKDCINSINCATPGAWIAFHDMLPLNWIEANHKPIQGGSWTGDVWKLAFELANTPGIDFRIISIDHGVGVFKLLDSKVNISDLSSTLNQVGFEYLFNNLNQLPIYDWNNSYKWVLGV